MGASERELRPHVAAVRRFNREYTRRIGLLGEGHLGSPYTLTQVRVLYELAQRAAPTATEIGRELGLDAGYLSRTLREFGRRGLVETRRSAADGRARLLSLTARGRAEFAGLDARAEAEIAGLLRGASLARLRKLGTALETVAAALAGDGTNGSNGANGATGAPASAATTSPEAIALRPHRPGDMGWVIERHGALYAQEYGYDERFEALVAEIAARFLRRFDPARERCWIAERGGERVGCVFVVAQSRTVAKLRMLLVEPSARGMGLGWRLIDECVRFARAAGYKKMTLWTHKSLTAARRLYRKAGFRLVKSVPNPSFGRQLVDEFWDIDL